MLAPVGSEGHDVLTAPWSCPVCRAPLVLITQERRWLCESRHSFDVAREGYVNLLLAARRRSPRPGDSPEMVGARRRFLATGAFDPLSSALADLVGAGCPDVVLDVACGEGRHTRRLPAPVVLGVDIAKPAVAAAARRHRDGWYAVASAADLPLPDGAVDVALAVFGPVVAAELARVVRPSGLVVIVHPGPSHLEDLRRLVYAEARAHEDKDPLPDCEGRFTRCRSDAFRFRLVVGDPGILEDLFVMTPYRWHASPDIRERLVTAAAGGFETTADVRVTAYRRT